MAMHLTLPLLKYLVSRNRYFSKRYRLVMFVHKKLHKKLIS